MSVGSRLRDLARPLVPQPIKDLYHWPPVMGRRLRGIPWLKRHAPEVYWRLRRPDLPKRLRDYLLNCIFTEPYSILAEPYRVGEPLDTDVLYVTDNPVPDIVKEVIALKRVDPSLHCSALVFLTSAMERQGDLYRRHFDRVEPFYRVVELINWIRTARAKVVVPTRRSYREGILPRLFFDGRVVFRPVEFHMALGEDDPSAIFLLAERYLLEGAPA